MKAESLCGKPCALPQPFDSNMFQSGRLDEGVQLGRGGGQVYTGNKTEERELEGGSYSGGGCGAGVFFMCKNMHSEPGGTHYPLRCGWMICGAFHVCGVDSGFRL